jgi:hypothetical protein
VGTLADDFLRQLRNARDGAVVIVGHNDGGRLPFGDGSFVSLATLPFLTGGAKVVLVSCESESFDRGLGAGMPTKLVIEVAVATQANMKNHIQQYHGELTASVLQSMLMDSYDEAVQQVRSGQFVKATVMTSGVAVPTLALYEPGT